MSAFMVWPAVLVLLIMLGAIVAIASLLFSEKGRTILKVLLIVPALALVLILLSGVCLRVVHELRHTAQRNQEATVATVESSDGLARQAPLKDTMGGATRAGPIDTSEAADTPAAEERSEEASAEEEPAPGEDRPDWVEAKPGKVDGAYQMSITVGPYSTRLECDQEVPRELHRAIDEYVAAYLGPKAQGHVRLPLDYIQSEIVKEDWEEPKQVVISPKGQIPEKRVSMTQLHLLLGFDHAVNARIDEEWDKVVVADRLAGVGVLTAVVLAFLAAAYAYLKIDLSTGGVYRGRLRLAAAVILAVIVAGAVLSAV